jgi:hypothetical protein
MSAIDASCFPFLDAWLIVCDILAERGRMDEIDVTPLRKLEDKGMNEHAMR